MWDTIRDVLPEDHASQVSSTHFIEKLVTNSNGEQRVLDLGCGVGRSYAVFKAHNKNVFWTGVDIEGSPEVLQRGDSDLNFHTFDGVNLPFNDNSFDIVYSNQVFEHVRYPEKLLCEVNRVLRKGGVFIGSVSTLEPYHSFSYWNYTPFGWYTILCDAKLKPIEFRPGIDGISLIQRSYLGRPDYASEWFTNSPLNKEIDEWGVQQSKSTAQVNLRKVMYCGHLVFQAKSTI